MYKKDWVRDRARSPVIQRRRRREDDVSVRELIPRFRIIPGGLYPAAFGFVCMGHHKETKIHIKFWIPTITSLTHNHSMTTTSFRSHPVYLFHTQPKLLKRHTLISTQSFELVSRLLDKTKSLGVPSSGPRPSLSAGRRSSYPLPLLPPLFVYPTWLAPEAGLDPPFFKDLVSLLQGP